jgi:hypothetical protein
MTPTVAEVSSDLKQISSLLNHVISLSGRINGSSDDPHLREKSRLMSDD